ncbi:MAG: hypothetical protein M3253_02895, partial [Chloroflexota bacterium]|nr:hypothetical protein [Chloroflexota bacterium]
PVLSKSVDDYDSERDRRKLEEVQEKTKSTRQRYQEERDAEGVRNRFKQDLSSDAAKKVHAELRSLDLPTLPDIKDELERIYQEAQTNH